MVEKSHEKSLQFLKKKISEKKILQAYLCRYDPQKAVQNLFLSKWIWRYLRLSYFKVLKNCSSQLIYY